jgi:hypothetical protein
MVCDYLWRCLCSWLDAAVIWRMADALMRRRPTFAARDCALMPRLRLQPDCAPALECHGCPPAGCTWNHCALEPWLFWWRDDALIANYVIMPVLHWRGHGCHPQRWLCADLFTWSG